MNIAKALKIKNRKARNRKASTSEFVSKFGGSFGNSNSFSNRYDVEDSSVSDHVVQQENQTKFGLDALITQAEDIAAHKAKIAEANVGIWEKIFLLGEKRGILSSIQSINASEEPFEIYHERIRGDEKPVSYVVVNKITNETKKAMEARLTEEIDNLQDEIDTFNATTTI